MKTVAKGSPGVAGSVTANPVVLAMLAVALMRQLLTGSANHAGTGTWYHGSCGKRQFLLCIITETELNFSLNSNLLGSTW